MIFDKTRDLGKSRRRRLGLWVDPGDADLDEVVSRGEISEGIVTRHDVAAAATAEGFSEVLIESHQP
jgi:hypothetical protein